MSLAETSVSLYHGDIAQERLTSSVPERDGQLLVATFIEVIEHIEPELHACVLDNVLGLMQPDLFILTTPNADFNK